MATTGRDLIETALHAVPAISNTALQSQLAAGDNIVVLDVREQDEWNAGHIPQGTFLARGRLEGKIEEMVPDKTTPVITH